MLKHAVAVWRFCIDIIFPPTAEEIELRQISPADFPEKVRKAPPAAFSFIIPLFAYKDPLVSELVWQIKAKKNRHAAEIAAFSLYKKLKEIAEKDSVKKKAGLADGQKIPAQLQKIILIPVPISKKRRRERGYNQCELLIDEIIKLDRLDSEKTYQIETYSRGIFEKRYDILLRIKHAKTKQAFKNRKERLESLDHVFSVSKNPKESGIPFDQKIIIIDDVITTGATAKEARETLLLAGYSDVQVVALAH